MKYIMISLYLTGPEGNEKWSIYGHIGLAHNEHIESIKDRAAAFKFAHGYCLPVMIGCGCSIDITVDKLANGR